METKRTCPHCGNALPPDSPGGICPHCAFLGALTPDGESEGVEASVEVGQHGEGRLLGDYELLGEVGRGGMGVVFKARQLSLNRIVAVKLLLHGRFADPRFRQRFRIEAEAAARLDHPNIVAIHEIHEEDGQPFFSMRWVEGQSLDALLNGGPVPPVRAARIMATLARAVHHAHRHGVLHRDLKPHNILIDTDGEPHLTDFGVSKLLESDSGLTLSDMVVGSPGYMAPEQVSGPATAVTTAADIFGLGAVLYTMLAGKPPFTGKTPAATLRQVTECAPVRLRSLNPDVPRDLETICLRCLQREPNRRYASAEELAADLHRWMDHEPVHARPVGPLERLWLWGLRRPWRAGLAAGLIVTLLGGATGIVREWRRAEAEAMRAEQSATVARHHAYAAELQVVQSHILNEQPDLALELLLRTQPESLRNWEWGWLMREVNTDLATLPEEGAKNTCVAFSPDGQQLITGGTDGGLRFWDLPSLTLAHRMPPPPDSRAVRYVWVSPDGNMAASMQWAGVARVWDLKTRTLAYSIPDGDNHVTTMAFSPAGDLLATGRHDGRVELRDRAGGEVLPRLLRYDDGEPFHIAFSPDGKQLAIVGARDDDTPPTPSRLYLADLATGGIRTVEAHTSGSGAIAFSPDGRWIAVGAGPHAKITQARTMEPMRTLFSLEDGRIVRCLSFSPDSRYLAVGGGSRSSMGLRVVDLESNAVREYPRMIGDWVTSLGFSPDGALLAIAADLGSVRMVKLIPAQPRQDFVSLEGHDHDVWSVAVSPDGRYIATGSLDHTVRIWETDSGRHLHTLWVHYPVFSVVFTPDGDHIVTNGPEATAKVWPLFGDEPSLILRGHESVVWTVAADPTGRHLATGSRDTTARIWDARSGALLHTLPGHQEDVHSLAFDPGGNRLATGSREHIIWSVRTGRKLVEMQGHSGNVSSLQFSPDGRTLMSAAHDQTARLWNPETGSPIGTTMRSGKGGIRSMRFSPDGRRLLMTGGGSWLRDIGSQEKGVSLWDPMTCEKLFEFTPHDGQTFAAVFTPDGTRIVTGAGDNTARIWPVFPWRADDYPVIGATDFEQRLNAHKRDYWSRPARAFPSPGRRIVTCEWGEENRPTVIALRLHPRLPIPRRPDGATDRQIDLTGLYNAALNEAWQTVFHYYRPNGDLAPLPPGLHTYSGITFDLRGVIQLGNETIDWDAFPRSVNIPIHRKIRRFHVVHSASGANLGPKFEVGGYRIHFASGDPVLHDITYGRHLRAFWQNSDGSSQCTDATVVWNWTDPAYTRNLRNHRLFMATYENPHPEVEVTRIEFVSGEGAYAPFLVGMTVE